MPSDAAARGSVGAVAVCTASLNTCSRATMLIEAFGHTIRYAFNVFQYTSCLLRLQYHQVRIIVCFG